MIDHLRRSRGAIRAQTIIIGERDETARWSSSLSSFIGPDSADARDDRMMGAPSP